MLALVTLAAYAPALHGGMLWDDDRHLTSAALQSFDGLRRIWTELGATQQYYPVVHSAFWIQHKLWGDATLGYHVVNVLLHATSAFLVACIMRRLKLSGAVIAACLFALHPVQVESIAWMTELKNALSGVLYLGAAFVYLGFDERRDRRSYWIAFGLFVVALLAKSVVATLPAALLVVCWWQRGRIDWKRDVQPLVPFFVVGIVAGLFTAWVERTQIGAEGAAFHLSVVERTLVAGRAIWFYLTKFVWPWPLVFNYPKWSIDATVWWQYLFPLAAVAAIVVFWLLRSRSRAPLTIALLFCGALFPALGFLNVYPFRYSYVADHFQYLATIPICVAIGAGLMTLARRRSIAPATATAVAVVVLGVPAFALTQYESRQYVDAATLYRETIRRNPASWMAHNNLAMLLLESSTDEALTHAAEAVRIRPDVAEAHTNLGNALHRKGQLEEAVKEYLTARQLDPNYPETHNNFCRVMVQLKRPDAAVDACQTAIRLRPDYVEAHANLGLALEADGRTNEALAEWARAIAIDPSNPLARFYRAAASLRLGRAADAVEDYGVVIRLRPDDSNSHNNLGVALEATGRLREALTQYQEGLRLNPASTEARNNIARVRARLGSGGG